MKKNAFRIFMAFALAFSGLTVATAYSSDTFDTVSCTGTAKTDCCTANGACVKNKKVKRPAGSGSEL